MKINISDNSQPKMNDNQYNNENQCKKKMNSFIHEWIWMKSSEL